MGTVRKSTAPRLIALSLALAACGAFGRAFPQEADPFDSAAFDSAVSASPAAAPSSASAAAPSATAAGAARTEYLVGGSVLVSAAAFLPSAFDGYALASSASGTIFGKVSVPDYGSLYISYGITQALLEARGGTGPVALAPPVDLAEPRIQLSELYYSFDVAKVLFLRVGKQLLSWGPSRIWSPVDFVNRQRLDYFSPVDLRTGQPGLKPLAPMGKANATLFADFSGLAATDLASGAPHTSGLEATRLAGRLDATMGGFELGLSGFGASGSQARAGLDFSGDLFGSSFYGELAVAPAYADYPGSVSASLGFSRALGDLRRWSLAAEGFYQSAGGDFTGNAAAMEALPPLYMGKAYGYLSLKADELFSRYLATTLYGLANLSDFSYSVSLREDFALPRSVPFSLVLSGSGGGANKEFTFLAGDRSLSITAQTLIAF